jgi:hypothetical protein
MLNYRQIAEWSAKARTSPGADWKPLADAIEADLKNQPPPPDYYIVYDGRTGVETRHRYHHNSG